MTTKKPDPGSKPTAERIALLLESIASPKFQRYEELMGEPPPRGEPSVPTYDFRNRMCERMRVVAMEELSQIIASCLP